jgi:hypothetical protein
MEECFMQRFKNVLVVIDLKNDCESLIERAVSLILRNQVPLTVIRFSEELPPDMPTPAALESVDIEDPGINIIVD